MTRFLHYGNLLIIIYKNKNGGEICQRLVQTI